MMLEEELFTSEEVRRGVTEYLNSPDRLDSCDRFTDPGVTDDQVSGWLRLIIIICNL